MKHVPVVSVMLAMATIAGAQSLDSIKSQEDLNKVVTALDTSFFDAYNRCDLKKFESLLDDDIEFYHDQSGLTNGKTAVTESLRKYICGKVTRELVPGTLEVHRMNGFGAVEMGTHRFPPVGHDNAEPLEEGKFIMLWQYKQASWKLVRVISYDHHAVPK